MDTCLTKLYRAYDNILTYEDKRRFIDIFDKLFINNYENNPIEYKFWFKEIITRIEEKEIDRVTIPPNSSQNIILLSEITSIKNVIDFA